MAGGGARFPAHFHGCWQDLVPYHMGFSAELPHDMGFSPQNFPGGSPRAAGFPRASDLRENHKCPRKKLQTVQPNVGTDIPSRLHILCMRSRSLYPAHTQREGIPQGCEYQEVGISGSHLRGSQPCRSLEENIPGRGNSQCEGLRVELCLLSSRDSTGATG